MGQHLDAHRARFLEQGDVQAFVAGFDAALRADALSARITPAQMRMFASLVAGEYAQYRALWEQANAQNEPTPEELLAALEPPTPATLALSPSQQLRASQNRLLDWWLESGVPLAISILVILLPLLVVLWLQTQK